MLDETGRPGFPVGTVTIQEVASPAGYKTSNKMFYVYLRPDANGDAEATFYEDGIYKPAYPIDTTADLDLTVTNEESKMTTELLSASGTHLVGDGSVTVSDNILLSGYKVGNKVSVQVSIFDKASPLAAVKVMPVRTFTLTKNSTETNMETVTVDGITFTAVAGHAYTAVATVTTEDGNVRTHNASKNDNAETVWALNLDTEVAKAVALGDTTVVDTITYANVPSGVTLKFVSELYDTAKKTTPVATVTSANITSTGTATATSKPSFSFYAEAGKTYSRASDLLRSRALARAIFGGGWVD